MTNAIHELDIGIVGRDFQVPPDMPKPQLNVYTNDTGTVIAWNEEDAKLVICEHMGCSKEEYEKDYEEDEIWTPKSHYSSLTICMTEMLNMDTYDKVLEETKAPKNARVSISASCQNWIDKCGRSFLASTEY